MKYSSKLYKLITGRLKEINKIILEKGKTKKRKKKIKSKKKNSKRKIRSKKKKITKKMLARTISRTKIQFN